MASLGNRRNFARHEHLAGALANPYGAAPAAGAVYHSAAGESAIFSDAGYLGRDCPFAGWSHAGLRRLARRQVVAVGTAPRFHGGTAAAGNGERLPSVLVARQPINRLL